MRGFIVFIFLVHLVSMLLNYFALLLMAQQSKTRVLVPTSYLQASRTSYYVPINWQLLDLKKGKTFRYNLLQCKRQGKIFYNMNIRSLASYIRPHKSRSSNLELKTEKRTSLKSSLIRESQKAKTLRFASDASSGLGALK